MSTEILAILIAFVVGALATAAGQFVIAREARLDRKEAREAERAAREEAREAEKAALEEASEQKLRTALSELASELRLNAAMPDFSWHHSIAESWVPFQLDAFDRARAFLSDLPPSVRDSVIEAAALITLYNTYGRNPRPTDTQGWESLRTSEPSFIREKAAHAAQGLGSWLSETGTCTEPCN